MAHTCKRKRDRQTEWVRERVSKRERERERERVRVKERDRDDIIEDKKCYLIKKKNSWEAKHSLENYKYFSSFDFNTT